MDLWMPVFAVCAVAVPERVEELGRCALALCGAKATDDLDDSLALTLLTDVRSVWTIGSPNMTTASLIKALESLADSSWAEPEHKLTPRKLAGMLRPFGIEPRQVRTGALSGKGYQRTAFEEVFSRYLPSIHAGKETCEHPHQHWSKRTFPSETPLACFGSDNTLKPS